MIIDTVKALADITFVPLCVCCGGVLTDGESTLCTICRYDMPLTYYPSMRQNFVVDLLAGRVNFVNASALMFFRRGSDYRSLIHRMKYGGRSDVARVLGELYGRQLRESGFYDGVELIVPVPLHWSRMIRRGYNQSNEFAQGIAVALGVAVESRALRRTRRTHIQARMSGVEQRAANVCGAFEVRRPELIDGREVLLVDDVITTGATLEACAEAINGSLPEVKLNLGAIAVVDRA